MVALNKIVVKKPGRILATPAALAALERSGQNLWEFMARHIAGDWGDVDSEDAEANNQSLKDGSRLLSAYVLADPEKTRLWIITEAEDDSGSRAATTALLASEY